MYIIIGQTDHLKTQPHGNPFSLPSDPQDALGHTRVDSIAVSLFGDMTVEPGEIHIITKQYQNKRSK